ncbi:MAG: nucleotidyltransferase domain-containing protein [Chloroflexi bacterium]|nr:nucleotidyltransferase domain-containing protein [Chloroflexota bacterium]
MNEAGHLAAIEELQQSRGRMVIPELNSKTCAQGDGMVGKPMVQQPGGSTNFWTSLRRGPWSERVIRRLLHALNIVVGKLRSYNEVAAVVVFGSYARGEYGLKSDLDLLILFEGLERPETTEAGGAALRIVGEVESEERLPIHIAPLLASIDRPEDLGPELLHNIWADGIILYGEAGALVRLQPKGLTPWTIVRFRVADIPPEDKVRLSRRLHGMKKRGGILGPRAVALGRGVVLIPATQEAAVREALDDAGATYDMFPVWREA